MANVVRKISKFFNFHAKDRMEGDGKKSGVLLIGNFVKKMKKAKGKRQSAENDDGKDCQILRRGRWKSFHERKSVRKLSVFEHCNNDPTDNVANVAERKCNYVTHDPELSDRDKRRRLINYIVQRKLLFVCHEDYSKLLTFVERCDLDFDERSFIDAVRLYVLLAQRVFRCPRSLVSKRECDLAYRAIFLTCL